jgi:hypothetical protein
MLQFRAFIQVLEVHDFSIPGVDISEDSSSESDPDDYPRFDQGRGSGLHRPWHVVYCHVTSIVPYGERWPSLPSGGGGASWGLEGPQSSRGQGAHALVWEAGWDKDASCGYITGAQAPLEPSAPNGWVCTV